MLKFQITLAIFISLSFGLHAQTIHDYDYQMRVSWVKDLKVFLQQMETNHPDVLSTKNGQNFLKRFRLLEEAWALDSRFDCFFAGWPSTLKESDSGKKLCSSPQNGNPQYSQSTCGASEMQCNPVLFGGKLCVSFKPADKSSAFQSCENKFQNERNGSYDFLKNISRDDAEALKELALLASNICEQGSVGVQKATGMCKALMAKVPDALKAIDRGAVEGDVLKDATKDKDKKEEKPKTILPKDTTAKLIPPDVKIDEEKCEDENCIKKETRKNIQDIITVINGPTDQLYEDMKKDFQASAFCDPQKIVNDPRDRPSAFLISKLQLELRFLDGGSSVETRKEKLEELTKEYGLSAAALADTQSMLASMTNFDPDQVARIKGLLIQDFMKTSPNPALNNDINGELVKAHIFVKTADDKVECPFVSKDAFRKAMAGREKIMRSNNKSRLKKPSQLTIVDYSRPSNERRMFVLDLSTKKVLHNTWAASAKGGDEFGASPPMSDVIGSNKPSDGFMIADHKSDLNAKPKPVYGPNVALDGIDSNNGNMLPRGTVLHGWENPMVAYADGYLKLNAKGTALESGPTDLKDDIANTNFKQASIVEVRRDLTNLSQATYVSQALGNTLGCMGVPMANMKHLDLKGRDMSQLEMLREDLPGSLMFGYSGPDMKSKYLP